MSLRGSSPSGNSKSSTNRTTAESPKSTSFSEKVLLDSAPNASRIALGPSCVPCRNEESLVIRYPKYTNHPLFLHLLKFAQTSWQTDGGNETQRHRGHGDFGTASHSVLSVPLCFNCFPYYPPNRPNKLRSSSKQCNHTMLFKRFSDHDEKPRRSYAHNYWSSD